MPFQTVNPAAGELIQTFEEISNDELELALGTAHKSWITHRGLPRAGVKVK
jgi:hypothetical protein